MVRVVTLRSRPGRFVTRKGLLETKVLRTARRARIEWRQMLQEPDIELLRSHDRSTWRDAFRELWPIAATSARGVLGNDSEIEDLAQASISMVPSYLSRCSSWTEIRALTWGIARRQALKLRRHRSRHKRDSGKTVPIELVAAEDLAEAQSEAVNHLDLWALLHRCLEGDEREIVESIYLRGQTSAEVAAELGITSSAVRGRLYAAMNKLRTWREQSPAPEKQDPAGPAMVASVLCFLVVAALIWRRQA
jgi:RNA polymerase sigma factor (sigma-70 family)